VTDPSRWLTVPEVMAAYRLPRSSVYALKAHVAWTRTPVFGLRFDRESIEAHIRAGLVRPMAVSQEPPPPRLRVVPATCKPSRHGLR
jgi:hypothetical protein